MASFKTVEQTIFLDYSREVAAERCENALIKGRFINIRSDKTSFQIMAEYKNFIAGDIAIILSSVADSRTQIDIRVTAADNFWARIEDPTAKIMGAFKSYLTNPLEKTDTSANIAPKSSAPQTEQGRCKACGAVNNSTARFCEYCGSSLR
jgi:hypothetical protein